MKRYQAVLIALFIGGIGHAQVSGSAHRALGQSDLNQSGINRVQGVEMYSPSAVALDQRDGRVHLYVADTRNHRILAWEDAQSYQTGDPPTLVLGQPNPQRSGPLGIGAAGFNSPLGLAADPVTGNLYVADYGNNRVLRFPKPFANPSRVEPDAFYGQPDISSRGANTGGLSASSMSGPRAVAFDSSGNLWVADSGNHRVLRFNSASLDAARTAADLELGQMGFLSGEVNRGTNQVSAYGFNTPAGLAFDSRGNLYVSDFVNTRVLKFAAPIVGDAKAVAVFGHATFVDGAATATPTSATLMGPAGIAVDASGDVYIAVPNDNRVLVFPADAASGSPAKAVLGQVDFSSNQANPSSSPLASARSFYAVSDVKVDAKGNVYAADTGNNRVICFPAKSVSAAKVWGQIDFSANGANQVKPTGLNTPYKIAIDYSQPPFALYVSDANNHRVLGWRDSVRFRTGDPADFVIGQPNLTTAVPNVDTRGSRAPSRTSLATPKGIAVDASGNLYVADAGNNRVLRYPRPVDQSGRIAPDMVIGQADFESSVSAAVSASSLRGPAAVTVGPDGDIFVADAGNNRVLEFAAGAGSHPQAMRVYGQPNFTTVGPTSPASAQTLNAPQGIFLDTDRTLYIADSGNNRILVFPSTGEDPAAGAAAALVLGQDGFSAVSPGGGSNGLRSPLDVAVDGQGYVFVADAANNRVLVYPSLLFMALTGSPALMVLGQRDMSGAGINWNSADGAATAEGLYGPAGLLIDRRNTLYVADAGNNRVLQYLKPLTVSPTGVVRAGTALARGGLASLRGDALSENEEKTAGSPWPLSLGGREVSFSDDARAPIASVAKDRIDVQIPAATALGAQRITVRVAETGELIAGSNAVVESVSPTLFSGVDAGQLAVQNFDGSANSAKNPALRGSTLTIFGTGQGLVSPSIGDGAAAPPDSPVSTVAVPTTDGTSCLNSQPSVCVPVGNSFAEIQFSGLAAGQVGVWQITVRIPMTVPAGDAVPLRAVINGVPSNIITVALK